MHLVRLPRVGTVTAWRREARALAQAGVPAEAVLWEVGEGAGDLFAAAPVGVARGRALTLPRGAADAIETALCHSDPERFARAYALVLRLASGQLRWGDRSDPALHRMLMQEKAVRRDIHKMHAFVRFREVGEPDAGRRGFAAWFEPAHNIVEAACPFFARRFGDMDWIIATPDLTARFTAGVLSFEETGAVRPPPEDATEALWLTYFTNIFNPGRLMVSAMTSEMPRKYWRNLPEAGLIPEMVRTASARASEMQAKLPTIPPEHLERMRARREAVPEGVTLETLKPALDACRRCAIGACASQGVAGDGPAGARLMIVGEQPGDQEDIAGRPFVGPAGAVFDKAAVQAELPREACYVTNAVKHFKFVARGKTRIHQRPDSGEVEQCRWWLEIERRLVKPKVIVAMGATAALALTGTGARLMARRGGVETVGGVPVLITLHPAHVLRTPDRAQQVAVRQMLVADLRLAREMAS